MSLNVEYDKLKIDATKSTIEETLNAQNSADPVAHTRVNELDSAIKQIAGVEQVEGAEHDTSRFTLIPKKGEKIFKEVQACLTAKGWQSSQLFIEKGRLDEVFRSLTQGGVA